MPREPARFVSRARVTRVTRSRIVVLLMVILLAIDDAFLPEKRLDRTDLEAALAARCAARAAVACRTLSTSVLRTRPVPVAWCRSILDLVLEWSAAAAASAR